MDKPSTTLKQSLNKAYLKEKVARIDIERLKTALRQLLSRIDVQESEANIRDHLRDFFNDTWYRDRHLITSKERTDLVVHADKTAKSPAAVLFEVKRPKNTAEMVTPDNLNRKALQELVLYYLRERVEHENRSIKTLIITDIHTWFLFDENDFERHIYHNKKLVEYYQTAKDSEKNTDVIYKTIGKDFLPGIVGNLNFTYFDLRDFEKTAFDEDPKNDHTLIPLYKGLSPVHLLRLPFANDSNSLDKPFYNELLHLIGLEETKEGGKKIITRLAAPKRHAGSLLENTIATLETEDVLRRLPNAKNYGSTRDEQHFNVGLELVITWVNRLLFLKLLESQLLSYHGKNPAFRFLNFERIGEFDELNELFFDVLAKQSDARPAIAQQKFEHIPYLNSSLFEINELESQSVRINSLKDRLSLPVLAATVLKDPAGRKKTGELRTLEYLFNFLDAYDFSSEGSEEIQEESKTLINAAVLGLIFEKINGYRDGSFFTPGFITMYMCRETIRRAVVSKFNERHGWHCADLDDLKNHLTDLRSKDNILEANELVNSLKICDPAVGSGHFLVSALNEVIAIKSELRILADERGVRLPIEAKVENDELIVTDENGLFAYQLRNGRATDEAQRIQQTLFKEKQKIIENCLFGVDINPNSVKICRLRLWIELLKNAFYKTLDVGQRTLDGARGGELETLPNIDINIKQGNSLIARFGLDADLSKALKSIKFDIKTYKGYVHDYHHATSRDVKQGLLLLIDQIKNDFRSEIGRDDPKRKRLDKLVSELYHRFTGNFLFEPEVPYGGKKSDLEQKREEERQKLEKEIEKLNAEIEDIRSNAIFQNAFEWRFEFPEVMDEDGRFVGFDVVLGNPPYIRQEELAAFKPYFQNHYATFAGTADLYVYFVERGMSILRKGGQFSYILPNKWMRAGYGDKLRQFVKRHNILAINDFSDLPVFEEATTYPCVFEMQNAAPADTFRATNITTLEFDFGLPEYLKQNEFSVNLAGLQDSGWTLSNQTVQNLLEKLRGAGKPLGEYVDGKIYYGIKTGLNEAFVIDATTRERLIAEDPKSAEVIKPFLAGRDIKRYQTPVSERFLIFTRRGIKIEDYPAILKHLEQFKDRLMPKPKD
ncbi:MAG: Eco57I restriction-modification methylase domain-containing protein, partial [Saprospiraceae bacterium]